MNWLENKINGLIDVFDRFPSLLFMCVTTIVASLFLAAAYSKFLVWLAGYELFSAKPFYSLIVNNFHVLKWGIPLIVVLVMFTGFSIAHDRYLKLLRRCY